MPKRVEEYMQYNASDSLYNHTIIANKAAAMLIETFTFLYWFYVTDATPNE